MGRRVFAETVLSDVRVIAIDQQLVQGATPGSAEAQPARTVTLEVTPAEAERIAVATRLGRLSLAVRPAESVSAPASKDFPRQTATWASDVSPALRGTPANAPQTMRLINGSEVKEFRF
jgi:pilus assembly protein CpaB